MVSGEAIVGESNNNPYNMTAAYHKSNRIIRKFYIPKAKELFRMFIIPIS